jgi:hypothetical protein
VGVLGFLAVIMVSAVVGVSAVVVIPIVETWHDFLNFHQRHRPFIFR